MRIIHPFSCIGKKTKLSSLPGCKFIANVLLASVKPGSKAVAFDNSEIEATTLTYPATRCLPASRVLASRSRYRETSCTMRYI